MMMMMMPLYSSSSLNLHRRSRSTTNNSSSSGASNSSLLSSSFFLLLVVFFVSCVTIEQVQAIYPDEVGRIDWTIENVGKVHSLTFGEFGDTKTMFVGTSSNVIAALNQGGSLAWRQPLPENYKLNSLTHKGKRLVTVANGGEYMGLWRATDGALIWDITSSSPPSTKLGCNSIDVALLNSDIDQDGVFDVAVLAGGEVHIRSGGSGELIRSVSVGCEASSLIAPENTPSRFFALGIDHGTLRVQTVTVDGTLSAEKIRTSSESSITSFIVLGSTHVVALDSSLSIHLLPLSSRSFSSSRSLQQLVPAAAGSITPSKIRLVQERTSSSFFVVLSSVSTAAVTIGSSGFKLLHLFHHDSDTVYAATSAGRREGLALVHLGKVSTQIQVLLIANQDIESLETLVLESLDVTHHGRAEKAFLDVSAKSHGGTTKLVSIVTEDHALSLVQDNSLLWSRDEGLATLSHVEIVDPPADIAEQSLLESEFKAIDHASMLQQFGRQIHAQILGFMSSLPHDLESLKDWVLNLKLHESDEDDTRSSTFSKDRFGLRKIILAASEEAGAVFGIRSTRGEIIWRRHFTTPLRLRRLHFVRSSAHYPPEALLVFSDTSSHTTDLVTINALTGDTLKTTTLNADYLQSFSLPFLSNDEKVLVVIDANYDAHLVPDNPQTRPLFREHSERTFFFQIGSNVIQGFGFGKDMKPFKRWTVAAPSGELYYALRHPREVVQSPIRSFAEQGVVSKYINQNTMAYATVSPISSLESVLDVYVLDTVVGKTIYHVSHPGARGPVHLAISENWVTYHFFNQKLNRYQITVIEFYYNQINWNATSFTSFVTPQLRSHIQSFHLNSDISAMGLTVTARGVTTKEVLVATRAGQIVGINKNKVLDPRRPSKDKITALERDEGLIPYDANIFLPPDVYHSYNRTIVGVKKFATAPALLESTCLVLAYGGLDLFYTRVVPSRGYDLLSPEFNSGMLVLTCAALLVATAVSSWFSKKKDLKSLWR